MTNEDSRLERIEKKIDQLSDAVVSLARMEERMITLFKRMDNYDTQQNQLIQKVDEIDKVVLKRGVLFGLLDRGFWLVAGIIAAVWARNTFLS